MRTVYKYPLAARAAVELSRGARILSAQMQSGALFSWAEVDSDALAETLYFEVVGTGRAIPPGGTFIATGQEPPFVWHVYEDDLARSVSANPAARQGAQ